MLRKTLFSVVCLILLVLVVWVAGGLPRFSRNAAPVVLIPPGTDNGRLFQEHARRVPGGAAILLLGPGHQALPAAQALSIAGIPFSVTHELEDALVHRLVFIPTDDRSLRPGPVVLARLKVFVEQGGTLVLQTPPDLLGTLTGIYAENPRRTRHRLGFRSAADEGFKYLDEPEESDIHLASRRTPEGPWTHGLMGSSGASPIAFFSDENQAAILRRRHGAGAVYTLGFDLKDLMTRPRSRRHFDANRCLTGEFEPAGDVMPLVLRAWHESGPKPWVRLRSLPGSLRGLIALTHNIGWGSGLDAAVDFSKTEKVKGIQATYFVQTKLAEDFLKGQLFDAGFTKVLQGIVADGHELASHSVAHGADLHLNALGKPDTPAEDYSPKVAESGHTRGATLLGEMGVSRRLIEGATGAKVLAFRSAFRRDPDFLDEGLKSTGYQWDSSLTACRTLTHFPFFLPHLRSMDLESGILELPMSWDDENRPEGALDFSKVLALLKKVSANESPFVWLVHPSLAPAKKMALDRILNSLPDGMAIWPLGRTARFWAARHGTRFSYASSGGQEVRLNIEAPAGRYDLSFELSGPASSCMLAAGSKRTGVEVSCSGRLAVLKESDGAPVELIVRF
ncbi:MAG: polysaccharide deacetylase family protein [Elusimicrobia bacterium]|nr:polysaccharide deacetylase family protein [Elusimicrobiota bacterium]